METSRWLMRPDPRPDADWRLFCFPSAGGGVSMYSSWVAALAPRIELTAVCPPGRERNVAIAPYRDMASLADELMEVLGPELRSPYAFFGHSFGAAVAFELATRLWQRGNGPDHLFVSACGPPHLPRVAPRTHLLDDDDLLAVLIRHGGIPAALIDEPAVLRLVLPALRADLEVVAGYRTGADAVLPCGITALGGLDDAAVDVDELTEWRTLTRGPFRRRLLAGGHFYLFSQPGSVHDALRRDLADVIARPDRHTKEATV